MKVYKTEIWWPSHVLRTYSTEWVLGDEHVPAFGFQHNAVGCAVSYDKLAARNRLYGNDKLWLRNSTTYINHSELQNWNETSNTFSWTKISTLTSFTFITGKLLLLWLVSVLLRRCFFLINFLSCFRFVKQTNGGCMEISGKSADVK